GGPAGILGLAEGRLRKGGPADLVLIDPDRPWRIDPDSFLSKSKNAPWDNLPVQGMAMRTVVEGRVLHDRLA
ncbi:MAG: dihydroorotase, partial [Rhodospirillaceae bacterium]|nr:dihydroorotase [Rhodospirillaceae bacterium]